VFRDKATDDLGYENYELRSQKCTCIWFNRNIRSKSKQYFYYDTWSSKGICTLSDILYDDVSTNVVKSFDDLIVEFDIPYTDRRKYNFFLRSIVNCEILDDFVEQDFDTFDAFSKNLISAPKVPRYTYSIMSKKIPPEKIQKYWEDIFENINDTDEGFDWETIHARNFKCTKVYH